MELSHKMLKCCFVITEVVNPKDAKEAARRLVESGVCQYSVCVFVCVCVCWCVHVYYGIHLYVQGIVIKKVVQRSHGFKRSKSLQEPVSLGIHTHTHAYKHTQIYRHTSTLNVQYCSYAYCQD